MAAVRYRGRLVGIVLRSAAVAVVPGAALALLAVAFLREVVHVGCRRAEIPGAGTQWVSCPDGIGFAVPAIGVMSLVGTVSLVAGVRRLAADLARVDDAAPWALSRDLAVVGAVPLVLAGPLSLLDATSPLAVVLSLAVGVAGLGVLVLRGRAWACLAAAIVTSGAAGYAFVVAPFALIVVALLVSAAVAALTAGRARVPA